MCSHFPGMMSYEVGIQEIATKSWLYKVTWLPPKIIMVKLFSSYDGAQIKIKIKIDEFI